MRADGGWALKLYAIWQVARKVDTMNGAIVLDADMFRLAAPASVLADDEERLEWLAAMNLCISVANDKTALLHPDEDDETPDE